MLRNGNGSSEYQEISRSAFEPLFKRSNLYLEDPAVWPAVVELIKAGQYQEATELLDKVQLIGQLLGRETDHNFLVIARQICQACSQCQAEIAWHRQAVESVTKRESDLNQQLKALLALTNQRLMLSQPVEPTKMAAIQSKATKTEASTGLMIYTLGAFQVYQNGQPILDWNGFKARSIFKYLLTWRSSSTAKDVLMDIFWPEASFDAARHNLHQAIHSLRKTLRQGDSTVQLILFEHDTYSLNPEVNIWLDYVEFENHVQTGQRLEAAGRLAEAMAEYRLAAELYLGDFLEEDLYEDWPRARREHFRHIYLNLVNQLSEYYLRQGEYAETIALCHKILAQDNCHEEAHRRLMRCYQQQGQRLLALRQYQLCVQALRMELDMPPLPETQMLYDQIAAAG
jgi:DNA-binding SARP family transcriptional activator